MTSKTDWLKYEHESHYAHQLLLRTASFTHALRASLRGVLERYFQGVHDLLLLHVDEKKLNSTVLMEAASPHAEKFPHIYGIDKQAIEKIEHLPDRG